MSDGDKVGDQRGHADRQGLVTQVVCLVTFFPGQWETSGTFGGGGDTAALQFWVIPLDCPVSLEVGILELSHITGVWGGKQPH